MFFSLNGCVYYMVDLFCFVLNSDKLNLGD